MFWTKEKQTMKTGSKTLKSIGSAVLTCLLMSGCSDDLSVLNSVGAQLLRTGYAGRTDTLQAMGSTSFRQYGPTNGRINLLGRYGGYTAYEVLQFYPSYFAERDTVLVLKATLTLWGVTWFGDSSAPWGFDAYQSLRGWGETTFSWDSLEGFPDPGSLRGSYSGSSVGRDTTRVKVDLDTAMVRNWLRPTIYTGNYGIILVPTLNSGVVRGFNEFGYGPDSTWPRLTVIARGVSGGATDTTVYEYGQDTFVGNIDNLASRTDLLYVQSGVTYRSTLKFDCSAIPRGAIINKAQFILHSDLTASRLNRFSSDSAVVAYALSSGTDSTLFESFGSRSTSTIVSADTLDVRHQVQNWIRDANLNYGLLIRPAPESEVTSFDLITFFNQNAQDPGKRPKLIVTYAVQSNKGTP